MEEADGSVLESFPGTSFAHGLKYSKLFSVNCVFGNAADPNAALLCQLALLLLLVLNIAIGFELFEFLDDFAVINGLFQKISTPHG